MFKVKRAEQEIRGEFQVSRFKIDVYKVNKVWGWGFMSRLLRLKKRKVRFLFVNPSFNPSFSKSVSGILDSGTFEIKISSSENTI